MKVPHLRAALLDLLDGLEPGEPLPPERTLATQLGASRMTVRRAVDELVSLGRVVRRHGAGTFAAATKVNQALSATSFSDEMRARGLEPGSRDLGSRTTTAGAVIGRHLELSPADEVLCARRLRLADGQPMAIEVLHVPTALMPGLTGAALVGHSFYATLADRYDLVVTAGEQVLEATVTDPAESEELGVPLHSPAFLFERTSRDQHGRVIEFVRSVYRGDRYRITASITAVRPAERHAATTAR